MEQTAVEWLEKRFLETDGNLYAEDFTKAKKIFEQQIIEFANWLDKLSPSQRVSVWSKDGSASGLFTMDNEQLFEQFKKVIFKSE